MEKTFLPDFRRVQNAAFNQTGPIPLYEHNISNTVINSILNRNITELLTAGDDKSLHEYFRLYSAFHTDHGYDTFSFEGCFTELVQQGEGLMGLAGSIINTLEDFNNYPWEDLTSQYFEKFGPMFNAITETLPDGMKLVGGVGNGMFETIQDFVPFTSLCYLEIDNPELFSMLWNKIGESLQLIWKRLLKEHSNMFAVCRFGDDLGFKASTLIKPDTIRTHVLPWYRNIIKLIHSYGKPFLLHSCGSIFDVMEDIIETTKIDAKHSNEDAIAPMTVWLEKYGKRIGNFGGIDMDILCRENEQGIRSYVTERYNELKKYPGTAIGSGNQIADYVPPENFQAMVETVRELRGF